MAYSSNLPCDGDGICMICKKKSAEDETITCKTCVTPWHVTYLSTPPQTLAEVGGGRDHHLQDMRYTLARHLSLHSPSNPSRYCPVGVPRLFRLRRS
ncbi:hypothetical protein CsSME_00053932 [Camellia sinensis var. sinensis]